MISSLPLLWQDWICQNCKTFRYYHTSSVTTLVWAMILMKNMEDTLVIVIIKESWAMDQLIIVDGLHVLNPISSTTTSQENGVKLDVSQTYQVTRFVWLVVFKTILTPCKFYLAWMIWLQMDSLCVCYIFRYHWGPNHSNDYRGTARNSHRRYIMIQMI